MQVSALLMAAGRGARFGADAPKQYLPLLGRPVLRHAAEALLRRHGSAGPVELPGGVSAYRLSLAQLAGAEPADSPAAGGKGKPVPREAARCGKLVLRPQKPPAK